MVNRMEYDEGDPRHHTGPILRRRMIRISAASEPD